MTLTLIPLFEIIKCHEHSAAVAGSIVGKCLIGRR